MPAFPILFSKTFPINLTTLVMMWFTGLIVFVVLRLAVRHLDMRKPRGLQNVMEWAVDFTVTMGRDTMPDEKAIRFILPMAFVMLIYLFVANWLGLIATINVHVATTHALFGLTPDRLAAAHGLVPLFDSPTANMSMTLGLAVMVWIISHARGLRHPKIYLKHFISPSPLAIIEEITNPLTHGMRLFGNIFAGEALLGVVLGIPLLFGWIPIGLPLILIWLFYSGFVSTIQAYVFAILMCLYVGNKSFDSYAAH